jgi:hypothetical protein
VLYKISKLNSKLKNLFFLIYIAVICSQLRIDFLYNSNVRYTTNTISDAAIIDFSDLYFSFRNNTSPNFQELTNKLFPKNDFGYFLKSSTNGNTKHNYNAVIFLTENFTFQESLINKVIPRSPPKATV